MNHLKTVVILNQMNVAPNVFDNCICIFSDCTVESRCNTSGYYMIMGVTRSQKCNERPAISGGYVAECGSNARLVWVRHASPAKEMLYNCNVARPQHMIGSNRLKKRILLESILDLEMFCFLTSHRCYGTLE